MQGGFVPWLIVLASGTAQAVAVAEAVVLLLCELPGALCCFLEFSGCIDSSSTPGLWRRQASAWVAQHCDAARIAMSVCHTSSLFSG
jgi:hypothetical protein